MGTAMSNYEQQRIDYEVVEQAIRFLDGHAGEQPDLKEIAASVNLSEYHFQRLFTRWVGISPKRYLQYVTKERAKTFLDSSRSVMQAAYSSGLSGPGRLHDLFVNCEAVTPGEYKLHGEGLLLRYGFHATPFGEALLGLTPRGVSDLIFVQAAGRERARVELFRRWRRAQIQEDDAGTRPLVKRLFSIFADRESAEPLPLFLNGTNFQIKVWEALLQIPAGAVATYEDVAVQIGLPRAVRAVGNAVGSNPLPVIIPCHRVIRKSGDIGGYRYGTARKKALLAWEFSSMDSGVEAFAA